MLHDTDFGLIYNDDSGGTFDWAEGPVETLVARTRTNLKRIVDGLRGTPVGMLCYCVSRGGDIMNYRSKVGTNWGARTTQHATWARYGRIASAILDAGCEPVAVVADHARRAGFKFLPSVRVNDLHFTADPLTSPLTPEFWWHHRDLVVGTVPESLISWYEQAPDFSHRVVRQYKLALIDEILDRFASTIDGIELDFVRHPVYFPAGEGEDKGHLITEMVRHVRARLATLQHSARRPFHLVVRVPTDLDSCRCVGLEVDRWLADGLIDVLIPAPHYFTAYDMPIEPLVALAHRHGCRVHPSLLPRQVSTWPFEGVEDVHTHGSSQPEPFHKGGPLISAARMRAAAANYWHWGVDGFAPYNFHLDRAEGREEDQLYRILRDLDHPAGLRGTDKIFAITKPSWLSDHPVNFQKQLPVELDEGTTRTLQLQVGEGLEDPLDRCDVRVRLGFRRLPPDATVIVELNGIPLLSGIAAASFTPVSCPTKTLQDDKLLAEGTLLLQVGTATALRQGTNRVTVRSNRQATLVDVELAIIYSRL